jgi:hypothetical protein
MTGISLKLRTTAAAAGLAIGGLVLLAAPTFAAEASLSVSNQMMMGKTVTIENVDIPQDGFVVIHAATAEGKPVVPGSIGHTAVKAGSNQNVTVELTADVAAGAKLFAMLHGDTGTMGEYEFGAGSVDVDKPVVMDGKPVIKPFTVTGM